MRTKTFLVYLRTCGWSFRDRTKPFDIGKDDEKLAYTKLNLIVGSKLTGLPIENYT